MSEGRSNSVVLTVERKRKNINLLKKTLQVLFRLLLRLLDGIYPRYMSLYIRYLRFLGVSVAGKPLYICSDLKIDGSDYGLIRIGRDVVISSEVRLLTHDYTIEKALKFSGKNLDSEVRRLSGISFGNDVFIGMRSTVLPGVSIGNRSIVGACSVVNKNIPPDQVWGGNPAKYICSMSDFSDRTLLKIRENPDEYLKE